MLPNFMYRMCPNLSLTLNHLRTGQARAQLRKKTKRNVSNFSKYTIGSLNPTKSTADKNNINFLKRNIMESRLPTYNTHNV